MTQDEFNAQWEAKYWPADIDRTKTNHHGWQYAGPRPSRGAVHEDLRLEAEARQERVDQQKLDSQSRRIGYQWKVRQMKQRGKRN